MQILFPGWPLPRLGLPGLGPARTGWAESQEVSMGGHHPHEVTGAPAEREGEGRVCRAWANLVISNIKELIVQ